MERLGQLLVAGEHGYFGPPGLGWPYTSGLWGVGRHDTVISESLPGPEGQGKACQPPHLLLSSSGVLLTARLALALQGPPLPAPIQGRFPEGFGGGDSLLLFFLQFSFQKKWNNSPGPCSPPSPLLPAFPAAPEPASCPCSSLCSLPTPAACRGGKNQGRGVLWERKEPGIASPPSPVSLPESG